MIRMRAGFDVLELLKAAGYNTTRIRKEALLGQSTLQKLRRGVLPSWHELDVICDLLHMQPGDLIERVPNGGFKYTEFGGPQCLYAIGKGAGAIKEAMGAEDESIEAGRLYSGMTYSPVSIDTITEAVDMPTEQLRMLGAYISRWADDKCD